MSRKYISLLVYSILFYLFLIAACQNKQDEESHWRLAPDEQVKNPFFPYELSFLHDTLKIVDGYNFKQTFLLRETNDSIYIIFENGIASKYSLATKSDSTIVFANRKFFRTSIDDFSKTEPYELLGYQSGNKFRPEIGSTIIHLVKEEATIKAILNDAKYALNILPEFLSQGHGKHPLVYLYLGKRIQFKDLIEVYCWLKFSGFSKVELVTSNESFEEFYSVKDYVNIDDPIFLDFLESQKIPPPPPLLKMNGELIEREVININSRTDLNQYTLLEDTIPYLVNMSDQLDIAEYLKLTEQLNHNSRINVKKKIIKFTTLP